MALTEKAKMRMEAINDKYGDKKKKTKKLSNDPKMEVLENKVKKKSESKFRPILTEKQRKKRDKQDKRMGIDESIPYPEFINFNVEQLPEIEEWEVTNEYELTLKVRMESYEDRRDKNEPPKVSARFEVLAVKAD